MKRIYPASFLLPAFIYLMTGCTTTIPKDVRNSVAKDVTFSQVLEQPQAYVGRKVMWAGQILSLANTKEGTEIEVLQEPMEHSGEPQAGELSEGRFIVAFSRYLDEVVYYRGKRITVVGEVREQRKRALGPDKIEYSYPVLAGQNIYSWPVKSKTVYEPYGYPGYGWYGYPGWGYLPYYEPPTRIIRDREMREHFERERLGDAMQQSEREHRRTEPAK